MLTLLGPTQRNVLTQFLKVQIVGLPSFQNQFDDVRRERRLRLRRIKFVREQFYLAAVAQNLKRLVRFLNLRAQPAMATA